MAHNILRLYGMNVLGGIYMCLNFQNVPVVPQKHASTYLYFIEVPKDYYHPYPPSLNLANATFVPPPLTIILKEACLYQDLAILVASHQALPLREIFNYQEGRGRAWYILITCWTWLDVVSN